MWRVQGLVGRALHRYHGSGTLRLPQNHHVEDEVISGSAALSTSRHPFDNRSQEDDGKKRKKEKTFQFHAELRNYTALDAVGWGAVAVLFMQICRRIHSRFSSGSEPSPSAGTLTAPPSLQKCGYRVLLEISVSRRDVLPRGRNVLCLQAVPEGQNQDQSPSQSSNSSETTDSSLSDHQEELLGKDPLTPEEPHLSSPLQTEINQKRTDNKDKDVSDKERLTEATHNLRSVGDASVPVILNIIGLESAKRENYEEAFCCFLASAQHGYSKAQFNTGVCYEKGRGVSKDKEKALHYYKLAAISGHKQAQYRYAKLLLASRGHQSTEEVNAAIKLLEEAATAGLTKAQICLASFYSQHPAKNVRKSIQYLKMAAESGDNSALFLLGQCYESGIEVQQNLKMAVEFYKRAAKAGNKQAKSLLTPPDNSYGDVAMRSIRSAPCFSVADSWRQPLSSLAHHAQSGLLPHSWSTGSLCEPPSLSSTRVHLYPPGTERGVCQWTVGIG
ncbi:death ligand signal enhancer isoform X1 [Poecilia reticulata]|uniref:death ligand signal enhancer isoform X1 n=1 Tax=Poecilia reticulata TaxID=8081 RepID=UPI0004A4067C|nr:PREDICTED: death ligand signal enhancer isoform X1 [Poecilia reticulata]